VSDLIIELITILLLLIANGVFAMSELAIISARKPRLEQRAEEGDPGALAALELSTAPDNFLSTVQIGITLIGILTGAVGGATLSDDLKTVLERVPFLAPYSP
jgi:putative hemolysin